MNKPPTTCENPHADCRREPVRDVNWSEDYTSQNPRNEKWLCEPCAQMLRRGTMVSPNELDLGTPLKTQR